MFADPIIIRCYDAATCSVELNARSSKDVARSEMMLVLLAMSMMRTLMTRVSVQSLKFSLQRCDSIDTGQWIEHPPTDLFFVR